ncbi:GyrI-like domain-containing protein [Natronoflexus pectinivorans]|uniref:GyrI-like small molecule binding protein n=1 Tax=Natronoflexus pectinivorans TaxID=682526 RepID=A0A4R2GKA6_9BACT|nr:GyrI-like domain-containing protein [Natronoflexus pectinivorans]TCO08914.1 GyrI-like small molecule binding protein [Natronoflexus pectinivorans]
MQTAIILLVFIITGLIILFAIYGGFHKIRFQICEEGGETVAFHPHKGDYKKIGKVMDHVYEVLLKDLNIETFRGFAIYHDDPNNIPALELRSEAGCVIEDPSREIIERITQKFQIKVIPHQKYLTTEFPYRGKLSVIVGVLRVYPAIKKQAKQKMLLENGLVIEIYDIPNKKIVYRKAIQ